jgi:hypothetical protein
MDKRHRDCSIRLMIGLFINLAMLKPVFDLIGAGDVGMSGGLHLELALIGAAAAVVTVVLLGRVLRRGSSWQQVVAIVLMPVPTIVLFDAFRYWARGSQ